MTPDDWDYIFSTLIWRCLHISQLLCQFSQICRTGICPSRFWKAVEK